MNESAQARPRLGELLDAAALAYLGAALRDMVGGDLALLDDDGRVLWGELAPDAAREALRLGDGAVGHVASHSAGPLRLKAAARLGLMLLRAEIRLRKAVAEGRDGPPRAQPEPARQLDAEARCAAWEKQFEARVQARVAQLEERQQMLYEAEKLAAVGVLAAGMAHEINNPLGFIRSNLATFRRYLAKFGQLKARLAEAGAWQALDLDFALEDGEDLLDESAKGLERIALTVSDLKAFSNVDRSTEEFGDINTCLRQTADIVQRQLPPGIELRLNLAELPGLVCLPGHLNQLFYNLLHNGIQAIQDARRPGVLTVSSAVEPGGIVVRIGDDGVGMTDEQRDKAFLPFYTTRPVGTGAGLGLTTARNIVLAHSGRIALDSAPGRGTTVSLFFPTRQGERRVLTDKPAAPAGGD